MSMTLTNAIRQSPMGFLRLEAMYSGVHGERPDPLGVLPEGSYTTFDSSPAQIEAEQQARAHGRPFFRKYSTPLLTTKPGILEGFPQALACTTDAEVAKVFSDAIKYASDRKTLPYGTCGYVVKATAFVRDSAVLVAIDNIFQKTLFTPTIASDLACVVRGVDARGAARALLVAGIRGNDPAKGTLGFFGALRMVNKDGVYGTGLSPLVPKLKQALGGITTELPDLERAGYDIGEIRGKARLHNNEGTYDACVKYVGTIEASNAPTEQCGEGFPDGTRRVHAVGLYALIVNVGGDFERILGNARSIFCDGPNSSTIQVVPICNGGDQPSFGIKHHPDLYELLRRTLL